MNTSAEHRSRYLKLVILGALLVSAACHKKVSSNNSSPRTQSAVAPIQPIAPLSANDVSWLFPPPTRAADFMNLIAVHDVTTPNLQDPTKRDPIWPDSIFQQFLTIVNGPEANVADTKAQISLPTEARSIEAWFIAGIRIDAGAPGLSADIRAQYGQLPEIRLIIQPVIKNPDGSPKVLDIAAHLIFDFVIFPPDAPVAVDCFPRFQPDMSTFNPVVADMEALRTRLSNGQLGSHAVSTAGVPLGIHPGLADPSTSNNVRNEMLSFLERHISAQRLGSMAIAGLPANASEPWIFLSIRRDRPGHFAAVHGPTLDGAQQFAQTLNPAGTDPRVIPEPHTNNLNPITCKNAAVSPTSVPIAQRHGVSTSTVFASPALSADQTKQILDTIADPSRSFFFNTDCVSCHTETRLARDLLKVTDIPGVNAAVLPSDQWNVRNFGWSPSGKGLAQATVTRRTATETGAVVTFINSELIAKGVLNH
jgi:hypothetical protein